LKFSAHLDDRFHLASDAAADLPPAAFRALRALARCAGCDERKKCKAEAFIFFSSQRRPDRTDLKVSDVIKTSRKLLENHQKAKTSEIFPKGTT
jgi:hypothetical protein